VIACMRAIKSLGFLSTHSNFVPVMLIVQKREGTIPARCVYRNFMDRWSPMFVVRSKTGMTELLFLSLKSGMPSLIPTNPWFLASSAIGPVRICRTDRSTVQVEDAGTQVPRIPSKNFDTQTKILRFFSFGERFARIFCSCCIYPRIFWYTNKNLKIFCSGESFVRIFCSCCIYPKISCYTRTFLCQPRDFVTCPGGCSV
jgi:hypothetical protein